MLRYAVVGLLLTIATHTLAAQTTPERAVGSVRPGHGATAAAAAHGPRPARIVNRVIDLVEDAIVLDSAAGDTTWMSRPFDTSQFTRAGIRLVTTEESDAVVCSLWWQFAPDDTFLPGPPSAGPTLIGDDVRPQPTGLAPIGFSSIFGLRARAVCRLLVLLDFGGTEPPPPPTAVISDVKVLLRLE